MNIRITTALLSAASVVLGVAPTRTIASEALIDLNGSWHFALDPLGRGEVTGWHDPPEDWDRAKPLTPHGWDQVEVPHCWSLDPRYAGIGRVWYRRSFPVAALNEGQVYRLQFGAVFHRCRVWINGRSAGAHEGGYLPFELDVTGLLEAGLHNFIAVEVDNSWDIHTLPGARPGTEPNHQLYPWWNYGGILRDVRIVANADAYVTNQKIESHLTSGKDADVRVVAHVRHAGAAARNVRVTLQVTDAGSGVVIAGKDPPGEAIELAAGEITPVSIQTVIPAEHVKLWSVDHPHLYTSMVTLSDDAEPPSALHTHSDVFGIRTLEVRGGEFLLNDEPVRLAGANRVMDHPEYGALEPDALVERDMRMMKEAHLEFARLQHYPCAAAILDWADRNGFLIIAEAASWGFPPEHLADPVIREKFKARMREMIEAQWNHPCIVGWSVGNEYTSWTPEGVAWTQEMKSFVTAIDDTRPVVFVGLGGVMKQDHLAREQRSLHYSDILCINCYMNEADTATLLDRVHAAWPDKPILITEYGKRADRVDSESARVEHFRNVLRLVRERPFICGLSYWTWNDYRSRYPGTNPNGYRPWGIVDPHRTPRGLYEAMRQALPPATLTVERTTGGIAVRVDNGSSLPAYPLRGYVLRLVAADGRSLAEQPVGDLQPGEDVTITLTTDEDLAGERELTVELIRPTGFVSVRADVPAE